MTEGTTAQAIIEQYEKHGWILRRVLFSGARPPELPAARGAEARRSNMDALWFSRRSSPGREAWELRRLAGSPLAFVTIILDETPPEAAEEALRDVEERMFAAKPSLIDS